MPVSKGVAEVPMSEWKWFGNAGHFICADYCRFHLCTQVGKYLVSTVGEYMPDETVREIIAKSRKIVLSERGDARRSEYLRKVGYEKMGATPHTFETMVFKAGEPCAEKDCGGCGIPFPNDWSELDGSRWMTAKEATEGHYEFCRKFAASAIVREEADRA